MPDLNTIPGFAALQALTLGDSRIKIAVLDGPAELDRACFRGANLSKAKTYWQKDLEPIDPIYIQRKLQIRALGDKKKALKKALKQIEKQDTDTALESKTEQISPSVALMMPSSSILTVFNAILEDTETPLLEQYRQLKNSKRQQTIFKPEIPAEIDYSTEIEALEAEIEALEDSIPKPVRERLNGVFHATGIFGTMFGQPGSLVEGVAPYCTAINIPLFETATSEEALSPLNLAHAFNLALELGVNIIHCAACHPTQTGFAHEMIQKAVKKCQDNNILIVAPSGNNKGEWFCVPAILPNVLAVGMMKDNGQPANYSNWGGQYQKQGILAPGENIPAAQPGTDEPARQEGTSLSAPLMTGISALLMSLQLQRGEQPNAEAVRQALLNSAIPCDPKEVEEPERCLVGKLNIAGAYQLLTGQSLPSIQPSSTLHPSITQPSSETLSSSQPLSEIPSLTSTQLVTASAPISPSPHPSLSLAPPASGAASTPSNQGQEISPASHEPLWSFQTPEFAEILSTLKMSLLLSVHEPDHLIAVTATGEVKRTQFPGQGLTFGLAGDRHRLAISTGDQIKLFRGTAQTNADNDTFYVPVREITTGDLDTHEMAWVRDKLWFVNTKFSCLCTLDEIQAYIPRWKPPFISAYAPEDRCHLNGLALRDGQPRYVTAYAMTDTPEGWRDRNNRDGILMDIETNRVLLQGLSMPHSPRWHQDKLWVLESGTGTLLRFDLKSQRVTKVAQLPGFVRGLYFWEDFAFVGLSKVRGDLRQVLPDSKAGVWVINIHTGKTVAFLHLKEENCYLYQLLGLLGVGSPKIMTPTFSASLTPTQIITASATVADIPLTAPASLTPSTITPSAVTNQVYVLGTLGYDFGSEARRDTFKQQMPAVSIDGFLIPANPYDARQMVNYLELSPAEGKSLIWTLNQELTPIYALEPQKAFASEIYAVFQMLLAGQIQPESSDDYIERVSIPGKLTERTVELFSGQVVPVLALPNVRGMYGWQVNALVEAAVATVSPQISEPDNVRMRRSLKSFLHRVYYDLRNLGQLDRDRGLNFAATNAFQAASTFAEAIVSGMGLDSIEVEKSPLCRLTADCNLMRYTHKKKRIQ